MYGMILKFSPLPQNDDFGTICKVMCPQNVIETEIFVRILKNSANQYFTDAAERFDNLLSDGLKSVTVNKPFKDIHLLNEILYRAPTQTKFFMKALMSRIVYLIGVEIYPMARSDILYYKSFDLNNMTFEGIGLVQTLMCICLYIMRDMLLARCALSQLEEYLELLPTDLYDRDELKPYLNQLENYKKEIMEPTNNISFKIKKESLPNQSTNELKPECETSITAIACEYVSEPTGIAGMYARKELEKGEVVISEDLQLFQFSAPFMNCAVCAVYREYLYNCNTCRYKSYCSLICMNSDLVAHKDECYGYKIGLIPMLEASLLFRCFLHAAQYLLPAIVSYTENFGPIRDASVAWSFITQYSLSDKKKKSIIREFLSRQPNCKLLTHEKWRQMINSSFRLAVFVQNDTEIIQTYFGKLELTKDDSIKVIAAMLMRLNVHIALNSQKENLQFGKKMSTSSSDLSTPMADAKRMNMNAFEYYSINAHTDFVNCFNELQERILATEYSLNHRRKSLLHKSQPISPMSEYMSKLIRFSIHSVQIETIDDLYSVEAPTPSFIQQHFSPLATSKRCQLLISVARNFHNYLYKYFSHDSRGSQEKISLCPILKKFKHSCMANVDIGFSTGKKYMGKTNTMITTGTELTVCHESVNFFEQSRSERHEILREGGIICKCDVCSAPEELEPTNLRNGILCAFCEQKMEITQFPGTCSECHADYEQLFEQYITFISYILREIDAKELSPKTTERELAILYGTYNSYVSMHFSEQHELRFSGVLSFVDFLTSYGFLNHASEVIISLHSSHYSYYVNNDKIYYRDIDESFFQQLRKIMEKYMHNINHTSDSAAVYPKKLLAIISHMLKRQEQYVDASTDDGETYNTFLENYTMYYKWKKIVNSQCLMPKTLQDFLNSQ